MKPRGNDVDNNIDDPVVDAADRTVDAKPCIDCTICSEGSLDDAKEMKSVACNVREFKHESFTVWRCQACGSLHCKEPIDFDRYYANYPLDDQKLKYLTRVSYQNRIKILRRAKISKPDSILDYGCGGGLFLRYLNSRGFDRAIGFDPFCPEYRNKPDDDQKFDAVYSFGVIEHVPDPRDFLRQQRRLVHPTGTVLIATPNADGLSLSVPDGLLMHQPYHRHIFSLNGLRRLAVDEGLELVRSENRNWLDTIHPGMNSRFVTDYIEKNGGIIDALFEKRNFGKFLTTPRLWVSFWFGYFFPPTGYMICQFRPAA